IAARRSSSQRSLTGHLDRGFDGVFEIIRVVGCGLISIAEVHAVFARANLSQSEPEMARDRFCSLEHHGCVKSSSDSTQRRRIPLHLANSFLSRSAPRAGLVALRQTFVRSCQSRGQQWACQGPRLWAKARPWRVFFIFASATGVFR